MSDAIIHSLPVGHEFAGYRILRVLGAGGFAINYLATEIALDRKVAIKEYLPNGIAARSVGDVSVAPTTSADREHFQWGLERFKREAQALVAFQHPNVVSAYRVFEDNGTAYFVMSYEDGDSLAAILEKRKTLPEDEILAIFVPLLSGLEHVHKAGFLHHDIKPGNIYQRLNGSPVLLGFGAARLAVGARGQSLTSIVSAGYAPFEQYTTRGNQGPWTDIYALGGVLYRAVVGQRPPDAPDRIRNDPYVPAIDAAPKGQYSAGLLAAIDAALMVDEDRRPQTVDQWRAMFDDAREQAALDAEFDVSTLIGAERPIAHFGDRRVIGSPFGVPSVDDATGEIPAFGPGSPVPAAAELPAALAAGLLARRRPELETLFGLRTYPPKAAPSPFAGTPEYSFDRPASAQMPPLPRRSKSIWRLIAFAALAAAAIAGAGLLGVKLIGLFGMVGPGRREPTPFDDDAPSPVDCSVFAPSEIARDGAIIVQVFVHAPELDELVARAAAAADAEAARRGFTPLSIGVPLGGRIAFSLQVPGLHVVDAEAMEVVWRGRTQAVQFLVTAPADAVLGRTVATVRVAVDGMPAGFIRFVIEVKSEARPDPRPNGDHARKYSKAYVCYASPDRVEVLKRVQALQVTGIECFLDVLRLTPGQDWEPALYRHIDASDLFLLFWSTNARDSEWVRKEVLYALKRQAGDPKSEPQIVPLLLEGPPPVLPPPELAHLHFNDSILYAMASSSPGTGQHAR